MMNDIAGAQYYDAVRPQLLDLFPSPPRVLLDVGCASGAMAAAAKARWPGLRTIGVELVPETARRAAERVDRVIEGSAEGMDFAAQGIRDVDAVLLADVLEHMVDPWAFLAGLRAVLTPDAVVVASIPNASNLWLLEEMAAGRFDYASEGLLDKTHLRFFTRRTIAQLFEGTGYHIERWDRQSDGRVDDLTRRRILGIMLPPHFARRVKGRRVVVRGADRERYEELRTISYAVLARVSERAGALSGRG